MNDLNKCSSKCNTSIHIMNDNRQKFILMQHFHPCDEWWKQNVHLSETVASKCDEWYLKHVYPSATFSSIWWIIVQSKGNNFIHMMNGISIQVFSSMWPMIPTNYSSIMQHFHPCDVWYRQVFIQVQPFHPCDEWHGTIVQSKMI